MSWCWTRSASWSTPTKAPSRRCLRVWVRSHIHAIRSYLTYVPWTQRGVFTQASRASRWTSVMPIHWVVASTAGQPMSAAAVPCSPTSTSLARNRQFLLSFKLKPQSRILICQIIISESVEGRWCPGVPFWFIPFFLTRTRRHAEWFLFWRLSSKVLGLSLEALLWWFVVLCARVPFTDSFTSWYSFFFFFNNWICSSEISISTAFLAWLRWGLLYDEFIWKS